jgi:hypothetical protein
MRGSGIAAGLDGFPGRAHIMLRLVEIVQRLQVHPELGGCPEEAGKAQGAAAVMSISLSSSARCLPGWIGIRMVRPPSNGRPRFRHCAGLPRLVAIQSISAIGH